MTAPFTDAALPEVCARVACALVRRQYNASGGRLKAGVELAQYAIEELPQNGFPILLTALRGLQCHLLVRGTQADWSRHAIQASRLGRGFRHCFFEAYKGARRDPRVTNRGVSSPRPPSPLLSPVEKATKG